MSGTTTTRSSPPSRAARWPRCPWRRRRPVSRGRRSASTLRIATDRSQYRMGEPVSVYVSSTAPCYLTLVGIGSSGQARVLLPNAVQPQNLLPAGQTVMFPGAGSNLRVTPVGPPGVETVTAICSADNRPVVVGNLVYGRDGYASLSVGRHVVLTRPGGGGEHPGPPRIARNGRIPGDAVGRDDARVRGRGGSWPCLARTPAQSVLGDGSRGPVRTRRDSTPAHGAKDRGSDRTPPAPRHRFESMRHGGGRSRSGPNPARSVPDDCIIRIGPASVETCNPKSSWSGVGAEPGASW